jgi:hypothetical protein
MTACRAKVEHIIPMSEVMVALDPGVRWYLHDGHYYVFRDKTIGDNKYQCQYGVLDKTKSDLSIDWFDCQEGALFQDVIAFARSDREYRLSGDLPVAVTLSRQGIRRG